MAYLLVAAMDIDIPPKIMQAKGVLCDIYLDDEKLITTMIPSTEERNAIVPLRGDEKNLTFECHFGRPDDTPRASDSFIGATTVPVVTFEPLRMDEWYELENNRLRCCTYLITEEAALQESPMDRVLNAQNFLMVALENEMLPADRLSEQLKKRPRKYDAITADVCNKVKNTSGLMKKISEQENRPPSHRPLFSSRDRSSERHCKKQGQPVHGTNHLQISTGGKNKTKCNRFAEDVAWEKAQPYRAIIAELEEKLRVKNEQSSLFEKMVIERENGLKKQLHEAQNKLEEQEKQIILFVESESRYREELRDRTVSCLETQMLTQEDFHGASSNLVVLLNKERVEKRALEADLEAARNELRSFIATRDRRERENEEGKRQELIDQVRDLHATLEEQARQVTEAYELSEDRCRTFESTLKERDEQIEIFRLAKEEQGREIKISEERIETLLKNEVKYQNLIKALEGDLLSTGTNEDRLQDAKNEQQRLIQVVERKDKKYDELRQTMEKQVTKEQERVAELEEHEKLMRGKLDACMQEYQQLREENERLEASGNQQMQLLVTTQERLKLSHDMEKKYAEKTAENRLLRIEKHKMEAEFGLLKSENAKMEEHQERRATMEEAITMLKGEMADMVDEAHEIDHHRGRLAAKKATLASGQGGFLDPSTTDDNQLVNHTKALEKELEALRTTILRSSPREPLQNSTSVSVTTAEVISKSTSCSTSTNNDPVDIIDAGRNTMMTSTVKSYSPVVSPTVAALTNGHRSPRGRALPATSSFPTFAELPPSEETNKEEEVCLDDNEDAKEGSSKNGDSTLAQAWAASRRCGGVLGSMKGRLTPTPRSSSCSSTPAWRHHSKRLDELAKARRPKDDVSISSSLRASNGPPTFPPVLPVRETSREPSRGRGRDSLCAGQRQGSSRKRDKGTDLTAFTKGLQGKIEAYVPLSADPVDMMLAQLLNSYEVLPVPFYRQGPGNYLFGSRKTQISIVGKSLLFRVGGGTVSFQHFMRMYQEEELQKIAQVS